MTDEGPAAATNRYGRIMESIFEERYTGDPAVDFEREDIEATAKKLAINLPKNVGDVLYSFRYRALLPERIRATAPDGMEWIIRPTGRARYRFVLVPPIDLTPNPALRRIKVPDATPGVIEKYRLSDEQALLAKLRYNRLLDIFTGITCYSLQTHLRTTVAGMGQVETDELYVGIDTAGVHYVLPVQAKGGTDRLNVVQIEQDLAMCAEKFSAIPCRAIGAQFMADDVIALFDLRQGEEAVELVEQRHYKLVPGDEVTDVDLQRYQGLAETSDTPAE
jgi:hypothetical protein